jgi:hypothetical protein
VYNSRQALNSIVPETPVFPLELLCFHLQPSSRSGVLRASLGLSVACLSSSMLPVGFRCPGPLCSLSSASIPCSDRLSFPPCATLVRVVTASTFFHTTLYRATHVTMPRIYYQRESATYPHVCSFHFYLVAHSSSPPCPILFGPIS